MGYRNGVYTHAAYTYEEVCTYLTEYKAALTALVGGQVKEYTIGSRSVTMMDLDEIKKMIDYFAGIKEKYENSSRPSRSVAVVFRDV